MTYLIPVRTLKGTTHLVTPYAPGKARVWAVTTGWQRDLVFRTPVAC